MANTVKSETLDPMGYEQIADASVAVGLTVPPGAKYAIVQAVGQNVRWRDDGTDPTTTAGMQLVAGYDMFYKGELRDIRFIEEAAAAEINVSYYA